MSRQAALEGLAHGLEIALISVRKLIEEPDAEDWVDQSDSPLGRRRHCELAKDGTLAGARLVNRKWKVRRRIVDTYIDNHGGTPMPPTDGEAEADAAVLNFRAPKRGGVK